MDRRALITLLAPLALAIACATGNTPCGEPAEDIIARHEAFPGELLKQKSTLKTECRQGKNGLWIGTDTFRMEWQGAQKTSSPLPQKEMDDAVNKARQEIQYLLGFVFMDEIFKKPGTINYEMTHEAFKREMRPILKHGTIIKQDITKGTLRILYQITAPCLRDFVYAKENSCGK